jgi:hypothetical protein
VCGDLARAYLKRCDLQPGRPARLSSRLTILLHHPLRHPVPGGRGGARPPQERAADLAPDRPRSNPTRS